MAEPIRESFVDGVSPAFHRVPVAARPAAESLALSRGALSRSGPFAGPGTFLPCSPFNVTPTFVQVSPDDEHPYAGEVTTTPYARSRHVEMRGELFSARPK